MRTFDKITTNLKWLPAYLMRGRLSAEDLKVQKHVMIAVADHFEPCYTGISQTFKSVREQVELVRNWAARYPQRPTNGATPTAIRSSTRTSILPNTTTQRSCQYWPIQLSRGLG